MRPVAVEQLGLLMGCKATPKSISRRPLEWGWAGILPPSWSDATRQPISPCKLKPLPPDPPRHDDSAIARAGILPVPLGGRYDLRERTLRRKSGNAQDPEQSC